MLRTFVFAMAAALAATSSAHAQAIGGPDKGRPVTGDPGISSMVVMDRPDFRVLRDWAEAGWIGLNRGGCRLLNPAALRALRGSAALDLTP